MGLFGGISVELIATIFCRPRSVSATACVRDSLRVGHPNCNRFPIGAFPMMPVGIARSRIASSAVAEDATREPNNHAISKTGSRVAFSAKEAPTRFPMRVRIFASSVGSREL